MKKQLAVKMNAVQSEREEWIDIARGILMILVVIGHSGKNHYEVTTIGYYIYQFHMPAFFIISGILYKPLKDDETVLSRIIKISKRFLIPYFCYIFALSIPDWFQMLQSHAWNSFAESLLNLLYGGRHLAGYDGDLWFITSLFFAEILFLLIDSFAHNVKNKILLVFLCYMIAHIHAWYFHDAIFPWSLEISFFAVAFYAFGFYCKKIIINKDVFPCTTILSIITLILLRLKIQVFMLELWAHYYTNFYLDFIIPVIISISLFNLCKLMEGKFLSKFFADLGKYTFAILALHIYVNMLFSSVIGPYGSICFIVVGVLAPYLIAKFIFKRFRLLKMLFIG